MKKNQRLENELQELRNANNKKEEREPESNHIHFHVNQ
jgi:hypothetical protein